MAVTEVQESKSQCIRPFQTFVCQCPLAFHWPKQFTWWRLLSRGGAGHFAHGERILQSYIAKYVDKGELRIEPSLKYFVPLDQLWGMQWISESCPKVGMGVRIDPAHRSSIISWLHSYWKIHSVFWSPEWRINHIRNSLNALFLFFSPQIGKCFCLMESWNVQDHLCFWSENGVLDII